MSKISVCIVDDNRELVHIIKQYLNEQSDIEVIGTAYNGRECLNMLEDLEPDILILDIIMPHIDGLTVLKTLQEQESNIHNKVDVIMLTAFGQEDVMRQAVDFGVSYFFLKPFDLENLTSKIREIKSGNYEVKHVSESNQAYKKEPNIESAITNIMQDRKS